VRGCVTASAQTSLAALATADADLGLVAFEMTRLAKAAGGVLTPRTRCRLTDSR
jgi:predicted regulator of Ras-like GTPase activity (Roadblock/LC7/MglB family)